MLHTKKKTKIVATIGPASESKETLTKMMKAGLNVTRINFSHGDHGSANTQIKNIRAAAKESGTMISILQDLSGPKIRTGEFEGGEVTLKKGDEIEITISKVLGTNKKFSVNYKGLLKDVEVGERILINDGKQVVKILSIGKKSLKAKVIYGGFMRSRRGVNLPDTKLSISAITAKDKKDLVFGVKEDVDFVAMSFVRRASDVVVLKNLLKKHGSKALIITKIETPSAIEHFDEILTVADGIMVARGDLAVEIGAEKVPAAQKMMIEKCNAVGKPVIVATQMLESMIKAPVPTRAEVADVSHAVFTGADGVMLSEESAMGKYPAKTVETMTKIAYEAEQMSNRRKSVLQSQIQEVADNINIEDAISHYAVKTAHDIGAKMIIALTESGKTARLVSRYRSSKPLLVLSPYQKTVAQTNLSFGAYPLHITKKFTHIPDVVTYAKDLVQKGKYAKKGDRIVVVAGVPFGHSGGTNTVHAIEI